MNDAEARREPPDPHYAMPLLGAAAAVMGLLSQLGAQHYVRSPRLALCAAPDCKSSAYTVTETCGGLAYIQEAPWIAGLLGLILVLQLGLVARAARAGRWERLTLGLGTFLLALCTSAALLLHRAIDHLFETLTGAYGELLTWLAVLTLAVVAIFELAVPKPTTPAPATTKRP